MSGGIEDEIAAWSILRDLTHSVDSVSEAGDGLNPLRIAIGNPGKNVKDRDKSAH